MPVLPQVVQNYCHRCASGAWCKQGHCQECPECLCRCKWYKTIVTDVPVVPGANRVPTLCICSQEAAQIVVSLLPGQALCKETRRNGK